MKFTIDKESELSVHQQLRQQIIFWISTGEIPIGEVMPSVRELQQRNKIHRNTISQVYAEMVEQRWMVRQRGRLVVVHPRATALSVCGDDVDMLIERLLIAAQAEGLSGQRLTARLSERVADKAPDHLLIVEPEPAMGEVLKYEVLKATGRDVVSYPIPELRRRPELLDGAALLVPAYLADLLEFVPARQRVAMTLLFYSPVGSHIEQVRNLASPTVIGMISVSGPGMRTMDGMFAQAIGSRHQLLHFWMEWPKRQGKIAIQRLTSKELPPDIDVRLRGHSDRNPTITTPEPPEIGWPANLLLGVDDLQTVDLLFCDSITYDAVKHPNRIKYQLLSPETLRDVAAIQLQTNNA